jgi:hypothetical protein
MGDFLKKDVTTPFRGRYLAAGLPLRIDTNSESILAIARENLEACVADQDAPDSIRLRLWVEEDCKEPDLPFPKPYFRGLGHLVYCGYNDRSSLVLNLRDHCGAGRFSRALAADSRYWRTILFPSLLGIVGPSAGLTSLHSACVAWKDNGLLLVGESGAGKSTLSLALAQAGLDFLADDRTLVSHEQGNLRARALSLDMKLRVEASHYFPALKALKTADPDLRFDPSDLGVRHVASCEPQWIVFLERQAEAAFSLETITMEEAGSRLQRGLHQESPDATLRQQRTIEALARKPCYRLRYGGDPHTVAGALRHVFVGSRIPNVDVHRSAAASTQAPGPPGDPLRRFRATCFRHDVSIMGRHIRIETDSPVILRRLEETFGGVEPAASGYPQFVWKIVAERREGIVPLWPSLTAFCHGSLHYISLGPYGFAAADLRSHEAAGVLPETFCQDDVGFPTVFLAGMLHLSAPALGLFPLSAACVARGQNGLLLFGPPNSGKTTASYWGKKLGLEFHADQATFLESDSGTIRAWGDFWPAAFRPETTTFLPEISDLARPFHYRDRTFLCVDKTMLSGANRGSVTPAACIFLERRAASPPRLIPVAQYEIPGQLITDAGSQEDRRTILSLLGRIPAYRLLYADDPSIAARFFRSVLDAHELMEQRV